MRSVPKALKNRRAEEEVRMPDYPEHFLGRGRLEKFVMTHFQMSRKATM
jgi:hypothetical protein